MVKKLSRTHVAAWQKRKIYTKLLIRKLKGRGKLGNN
jgi:hypothetical protein